MRESLAKLEQTLPSVVLMDNWIPDEGGIVSTQLIKKSPAFKDIPVIYFSANSNVASLALQAGAENYITKPYSMEEFESTIFQFSGLKVS